MLKRQEGGMTREEVKQVNKMSTIMERFYNHNVRRTPLFEGISLQKGAIVVRYGFNTF